MAQQHPPSLHIRDLPRVNEISLVLARNGFGHLINLMGISSPSRSGDPEGKRPPFAKRIRQALVDLGPTFVKFGQVLSVRPDILPRSVIEELETLRDHVPPMPEALVRTILEKEFDGPLEETFTSFDFDPLGSASIAQVHRAQLKEGTFVAVKVQRAGIVKKIRSDIHLLYSLAQLLEGRLQLPGIHTPVEIVKEFDHALTGELDFLAELRAAERMGRVLEEVDGVHVPTMYPQWSTHRVLVMELIEGKSMDRAIPELDEETRTRLAHTLMEATYHQVFVAGYFHGDPHPGNILVQEDGTVVFLDFGVTGMLTGSMQDLLVTAFTSLIFRDAENLALTLHRAGAVRERVDLKAFTLSIETKMAEYYGATLDDLNSKATFVDMVNLCTTYGIGLPPEFAVLSRAVTLVEASVRAMLPEIDIVEEVQPYARRLFVSQFSPEKMAEEAARWMVQTRGHLKELPTQLTQVLLDLEKGAIQIQTRNPDDRALREEIRIAAQRMSITAVASVTTLASVIVLAAWSPEIFGIPVLGIIALLGFGLGLGLFGMLWGHFLLVDILKPKIWKKRMMDLFRFLWWRKEEP
jgi:ubiquinone biosynthesis protein